MLAAEAVSVFGPAPVHRALPEQGADGLAAAAARTARSSLAKTSAPGLPQADATAASRGLERGQEAGARLRSASEAMVAPASATRPVHRDDPDAGRATQPRLELGLRGGSHRYWSSYPGNRPEERGLNSRSVRELRLLRAANNPQVSIRLGCTNPTCSSDLPTEPGLKRARVVELARCSHKLVEDLLILVHS